MIVPFIVSCPDPQKMSHAARLRPDGLLLLEVGMGQADPVAGLACAAGLRVEEIARDLQGIPRCVASRKLDL